jgi:tetratricopeptide (TPR) repeat protein
MLAAGFLFFLPLTATADSPQENANRTFVEAVQLIRRANTTLDTREAVRLLRGADNLLKKIVSDYPESTVAVQLTTNQFIGDFDILEFRSRIRSLSCERGGYVEDFLSEYGVATATGPLTEACFLYRMETLMAPVEMPIVTARPDWLSLAVAYYIYGQQDRAREIIQPFLSLLRKSSGSGDTQDSFVFMARALALTGAFDQAIKIGERLNDCSNRLYLLMELLKITLNQGEQSGAKLLADQIKNYVNTNQCAWQKGLVATALYMTDRRGEAKLLYEKAMAEQTANLKPEEKGETTPPDLVMAAALMDDPATTLSMLRSVQGRSPWIVAPVLEALAQRGYKGAASDFVDEINEPERRAEAYAALIGTLVPKGEDKKTSALMTKLQNTPVNPSQAFQQSMLLALRAWAERAYFKDERWREAFQSALNAAERVDEDQRIKIMPPLLATLMQIKTNKRVLNY